LTAAFLINQKQVCGQFARDNNRFRLTGVKLLPQNLDLHLVFGLDDSYPRRLQRNSVPALRLAELRSLCKGLPAGEVG
jgi:hypothetical protein